MQRAVVGGQAQHVRADTREIDGRVRPARVAEPHRAGSADLAPGQRQRAGRIRLAIVVRRAVQRDRQREVGSSERLVRSGVHNGQSVAGIFETGRRCAGTGAPVDGIIAVGRGVESLERGPKAVRIRRPRRFVIITHHIHIDVWNEYRPRVGVEVGGVRALQRQRLPAVLERAGKRPEDRHAGGHAVLGAKRRGITVDDQQQAVGRDFSAGREIKADAMQPPRVRGIIRVIKFHRRVGDALQLDEFHIAQRRVITDFVDDHRSDTRPGVRRSQSVEDLRRILRLAGADDVAAKGHSVLRRAKTETVAVTGQIPGGVR